MYGHDMHEGEWNRQQDKLINQLEKGINGEYSASSVMRNWQH